MKQVAIALLLLLSLLTGCSDNKIDKKGFQVSTIETTEEGEKVVGLKIDSLKLETRPRNVLTTKYSDHRLSPIYKVNYSKKRKKPFTGSNRFHKNWYAKYSPGNNWNQNFMPGFNAVYGYNMVNVSHYNNQAHTQNLFFASPVLIKTLYYPANSNDTLNYEPVTRKFYMVSVYDEDSNVDGFITVKDLRHMFYFNLDGKEPQRLIPKNYSVVQSEYDAANDYMYVFAKKDVNQNGQIEDTEPMEIFLIELENPKFVHQQYKRVD